MGATGEGLEPRAALRRPAWLSVFAVVAIVLGAVTAFTVANEVFGARMLAAQRRFMANLSTAGAATTLQLDLQARVAEAMARTRPFFLAVAPVGLLAAAGMIAGGIGCLSLRPRARAILVAAFALGIAYEIAVTKPTYERQQEVMAITASSMTSALGAIKAGGAGPGDAAPSLTPERGMQTVQQMMGTFMNVASAATVAFVLAWSALKIGFLAAGAVYLSRRRTRDLFGRKGGGSTTS